MELDHGAITILVSEDKAVIEIRDTKSSLTFCRIELSPEQFCQALSRLSNTECKKAEVFNLEKIGKKMEMDTLVFEIGDVGLGKRKSIAKSIAQKECPEGWESDLYFGSQTSFFTRGGKQMARTTIRRWV